MGLSSSVNAMESEKNIEKSDKPVEEILILGVRQDRVSEGATGLTLELNETPQSISVINAQQIENFATTNLDDALRMATGITVEKGETNRTSYTSRGFDIKSTQVDGIGLPNSWGLVTGAMDSYGFEEVEVIRGANGQLTGVGNSAGTINYVRKRPKNDNEGEVSASLGSYDYKRLEADYSFLLTESGSWAARVVAALEDKESYLDGLKDDRTYLSFVVDGQLTDNSTLAFGASYQDANSDGIMWGGLVFNYSDGTQAEWDVSASPTQEWTKWDTLNTTAFIEYTYVFDNDWEVKATYNRQDSEDEGNLFYIYGSIDPETKLGLLGNPGAYDGDFNANLFDITSIGKYSLFGNEHELTLGVSRSESNDRTFNRSNYDYSIPAWGALPAFPYALDAIPEPEWNERQTYSDIDVTLTRFFGSTKLNITDDLFVVAGFNAIEYKREGYSNSTVEIYNDEKEISPYLAATYAITDDINAYVSYSDVYQPQEQYDFDGEFLDPSKGVNYEIGLKTQWFDDNVLATFAFFRGEQENIAAFAGVNELTSITYYEGTDIVSEGFEFELTGQLTENLYAIFAYTYLDIEDQQGNNTNEWVATDVVNFTLDYTLPAMPEVALGVTGKWQSDTENLTYNVKQGSYLVANAFVRWDISNELSVQANIENITDEKYITSLNSIGYYGAPTQGRVSVTYQF
jgi:outer membrane receptor for ferric coprogen and ferric-rhodotorulic acid